MSSLAAGRNYTMVQVILRQGTQEVTVTVINMYYQRYVSMGLEPAGDRAQVGTVWVYFLEFFLNISGPVWQG